MAENITVVLTFSVAGQKGLKLGGTVMTTDPIYDSGISRYTSSSLAIRCISYLDFRARTNLYYNLSRAKTYHCCYALNESKFYYFLWNRGLFPGETFIYLNVR
jgi:hypothetical protein